MQAIVGILTKEEAGLVSEIDKIVEETPIISLTSYSSTLPSRTRLSPSLVQMGGDITLQINCIAAIVGHFQWKKVTAIYEHIHDYSTEAGIINLLSNSLKRVDSEMEHRSFFSPFSSLSDPRAAIEEELKKLRSRNNRVFIVVQFSLQLAIILFEKAKEMGMMGNGYVWIVSNDIASLLDSVDSSVISSMQGVLGLKTQFEDTSKSFRDFKLKFRAKYALEYPEEEEKSNPSIFALQTYDATQALAQAMQNVEDNFSSKKVLENILSSNFQGLSGKISFSNNKQSNEETFQIINVVGKSYRELGFWSPELGFSGSYIKHNGSAQEWGPVYWPGGLLTVPKGWSYSSEERQLKIGVPAIGAFRQFVSVNYDQRMNGTNVTGFSVSVFEAAVRLLPYQLPYQFVPFYGSYDDMVVQVYQKVSSTFITAMFGIWKLLKIEKKTEKNHYNQNPLKFCIFRNFSVSPYI